MPSRVPDFLIMKEDDFLDAYMDYVIWEGKLGREPMLPIVVLDLYNMLLI